MKRLQFAMPGLQPFVVRTSWIDDNTVNRHNAEDHHVHGECEIYVNFSGDVSFVVEQRLCPVVPGSVVITRPYEYHHCIYHSDAEHHHFCLWFSAEGNEALFPQFFDRKQGEGNLLTLPQEKTERLYGVCRELASENLNGVMLYQRFFLLLELLSAGETAEAAVDDHYPDVQKALEYLGNHWSEPVSIREAAAYAHVSVSSLERHFREKLQMTPNAWLKKKRLSKAAEFLAGGCTVTEAAFRSGFADVSGFIAQFRKTYHVTPLRYKKQL